MRIVDSSVFYGPWPFRDAGTEDMSAILARCAGNGVTDAMVSSVQSIFYQDPFEAELKLHRAIRNHPAAKHVYTVNPLAAGWEDDLRTAIGEFDVRALKIYPGYHPYSLQGPEIAQVCEAAGKYELPLIVACCVEDVRVWHMVRQTPLPVDQLGVFLGSWRDVRIVLSNISFGETMALRPYLCSRDGVYVDMAGFKFISFPIEKLLKVFRWRCSCLDPSVRCMCSAASSMR